MIPPLARQFVAGESAAEVIEYTRRLNEDDVGAILNLLGEHYGSRAPADADTDEYVQLLTDLDGTDLRARLSAKPTQLGLSVGESVFRENAERLFDRAAACDRFVWLDMEDHETVDATLDVYEAAAREHGDVVGVAIQANLKRTTGDLERLAALPGKVRLVKGAYSPPAAVAHQDKARVNEAFRSHLRYLFEHFEDGIAVGSHDPAMLSHAAELHEEYGTPYEIQMLMGVREERQRELATAEDVWQYVPYGDRWLSYFYRRVTERTENLTFALRALLGR